MTERHLLFALSKKLIERYGKGERLVEVLTGSSRSPFAAQRKGHLLDPENSSTNMTCSALEGDMVQLFYIDAAAECPNVQEIAGFARKSDHPGVRVSRRRRRVGHRRRNRRVRR